MSNYFLSHRSSGILVIPILGMLGVYSATNLSANSNGITGHSKDGCGRCHGTSASPKVTVRLWTNSTTFQAGQTYEIFASVRYPGSSGDGAGCNISADRGAVIVPNSDDLQSVNGELTQKSLHLTSLDTVAWVFMYTAPRTPGPAHIYLACCVANLNGTADSGDVWGTTVATINIGEGPHFAAPDPPELTAIVGDTASEFINLYNNGPNLLTIKSCSISFPSQSDQDAFQFSDTSTRTIPAGGQSKMHVLFRPGSVGGYSSYVKIYTDDEGTPSINVYVSGFGVAYNNILQITPSPADFGQVKLGLHDSMRVVLRDTGRTPIQINGFYAFGTGTGTQQLGFDGRVSYRLFNPGDSQVYEAYYNPIVAKTDSLVIGVRGADGVTFVQNIFITGRGVVELSAPSALVDQAIQITPNPSTGKIHISATHFDELLDVFDEIGRTVYHGTIDANQEHIVDLRGLQDGSYVVRFLPQATAERTAPIYRHIIIDRR